MGLFLDLSSSLFVIVLLKFAGYLCCINRNIYLRAD